MLKADFHTHTSEDPFHGFISYSAQDLIKYMAKKNYDVLSITLHNTCLFNKDLESYAKKHGITLIPGMEVRMNNKDILILNVPDDYKVPTTWRGVRKLKQDGAFIVAPHPYFIAKSLGNHLVPRIKLFDAIEVSHWYHRLFNRNTSAIKLAEDFNLPLIGTSDCHRLWQIGNTYTEIDANPDKDSILEAIRKKQVKVVTNPLNTFNFLKVPLYLPFDTMIDVFIDKAGFKK